METEIWKSYNDKYEASSLGRVRNVKSGKILKPFKHSTGYILYQIGNKGKSPVYAHRIVAKAFFCIEDKKNFVVHVNRIKDDNRPENLKIKYTK